MLDMQCPNKGSKLILDLWKEILPLVINQVNYKQAEHEPREQTKAPKLPNCPAHVKK